MRRLPIDHCPSCGVRSLGNTYCARCDVDMVDANGLGMTTPSVDELASAPRVTSLVRYSSVTLLASILVPAVVPSHVARWHCRYQDHLVYWLALSAGALGVYVGHLLVVELRLRRPWTEVQRIAEAGAGSARVRGVVSTIVPSAVPDATETTAIRVRRVLRPRLAVGPASFGVSLATWPVFPLWTMLLQRWSVVDTSVAGRFCVADGSGIAIVDEHAIEVFDARPFWVRWASPFERVEDGDEVDVLGPARREAAMDASVVVGAGEAHAERALVFDGRPWAKVRVLLRRKARR